MILDDYTPVTNSSLFINDMDSGADSLTYSISFTDQNYRFLRSPTEPGTEGVLHSVAEPSLKFTQHEINNGLILLQIFGKNFPFIVSNEVTQVNLLSVFPSVKDGLG